MNLNRVFLVGNLTKDPELRYTPQGVAVVSFRLAVNRVYKTQAGEEKKETCFIDIVVWGKQAVPCSEYLGKGSSVLVEGRLQSRSWESNGQKRSTIEVVASRVQFIVTKKKAKEVSEDVPEETEQHQEQAAGEEAPPF